MPFALIFAFIGYAATQTIGQPPLDIPFRTVNAHGMPIHHTAGGLPVLRYDEMIVWEKPLSPKPVCYEEDNGKVLRIVACGAPNGKQAPSVTTAEPVTPAISG